MRLPSVFEAISKLSNEKVAVRVAHFIDEKLPSNRFTHPLLCSASLYLRCVQKSSAWCKTCGNLVIGASANPTIHNDCDYPSLDSLEPCESEDTTPITVPESWWVHIMNPSSERPTDRRELDPDLAKILAGWEDTTVDNQLRSTFADYANPDPHRPSQESANRTDDYDEEDFSNDEPADADAHPITKEN